MIKSWRSITSAVLVVFVIAVRIGAVLPDHGASASPSHPRKLPTILIAVLVRNKEHTLPYFLTFLERLDYPKDRLSLWIRSDHNEDRSIEILEKWINRTSTSYHSVDFQFDRDTRPHHNETTVTDWPKARFQHLIKLKTAAFEKAKKIWADFIFYLDADIFLTETQTLKHLTSFDVPIISPMLRSDGLYSNYWCGMSDDYYYERTSEYREIYEYKKYGHFSVPMVHSAVLINLKYEQTSLLTFQTDELRRLQNDNNYSKLYNGPLDDIIIFAISAKSAGLDMLVHNERRYGYLMAPLDRDEGLDRDRLQLVNIKLNIINELGGIVEPDDYLLEYVKYPESDSITLDKIYMINLLRRPERHIKMAKSFKEIGLEVEHFPAVDGRELNLDIIEKMGIRFLAGYEDPYHHRQMTMGEIGCFLSHYKIWEKIVEKEYKEVLILEDDIYFEPYFMEKALHLLDDARSIGDWDLIYFGRKRLEDEDEPYVDGVNTLVHVGYSYWTLGYLISLSGARKLLAADPLRKLIPVDEFLPVMFGRHPNETWSQAFEPRNLIAFSAVPLLLYPTHYTGDDGYISDTEDSELTPTLPGGSNAQLKSDKGRENISQAFINVQDIKHKSGSSVLMQEIRDGVQAAKHDHNEL